MNEEDRKVSEVLAALDGFRDCAKRYAADTAILSFTKYDHPDYIRMVEMGDSVIPLIIEDLRNNLDEYYKFSAWAHISILFQVVKDPPILSEKQRGKFNTIVHLWLRWADEHGY